MTDRKTFLNHKRRLRGIVDRDLFYLTKSASERPFVGRQGLYYFLLTRAGSYAMWGRYYLGQIPHPRWKTYISTPNPTLGQRYVRLSEDLKRYVRRCARFVNLFRKWSSDVRSREIKEEEDLLELKENVYNDKVLERDFIEQIKVDLSFKYPTMRDLISDVDWYSDKVSELIRKLEDLINEEKYVYRLSMVWMFYAKEIKENTPVPFAEFRVWVLTRNPTKYNGDMFRHELYKLTKIFFSINVAWHKELVYLGDVEGTPITAEIVGIEKEPLDKDEIEKNFASTGLPREEWKYDTFYRYACFFERKAGKKIPAKVRRLFRPEKKYVYKEYNEAKIRQLEGTPRIMEIVEKWEKWKREHKQGGGK